MAGTGVDNYSYILVKDIPGEKAPGKIRSVIGGGPKEVQVLRGELLTLTPARKVQPRFDGKPCHNYRVKKEPNITLYAREDELAPLGRGDLELLEAIDKPFDRLTVFSEDNKLEWGANLKKGDRVYVRIPGDNTSVPDWSVAVVQYVGKVHSLPGRNFGVEIKDPRYRGRGSTNGLFLEYQYFLFVSLDKLSDKPNPNGPQGAAQQQLLSQPKSSILPPRLTNPPKQPTVTPGGNSASGITSSVDSDHQVLEQPRFKIDERLAVYDKNGKPVYGRYRWSGTDVHSRQLDKLHIGIDTDEKVFSTDIPNALPGMSNLFHAEQWHHLVVPAECVMRVREDGQPENEGNIDFLSNPVTVARELKTTQRQLMADQKKLLREAEQRKKKEENAKLKIGNKKVKADHELEHVQPTGQVQLPLPNVQQQPPYNQGGQTHFPNRLQGDFPSNAHQQTPGFVAHIGNVSQFNLEVGSAVQLATTDPNAPQRYGVIKWIGTVPQVQGEIAGIELEEYMDGCNEGTIQSTGQKHFDCPPGHGLYFPLANLKPDERFSSVPTSADPGLSTDGNRSSQQVIHHYPSQPQSNTLLEIEKIKQENTSLLEQLGCEKQTTQELSSQNQKLKEKLASCKKELAAHSTGVWKVSPNKIEVGIKIGVGGWGTVSKGKIQVAIKELHPAILSPKFITKIKREMKILAEVHHPNLVQFIGTVFDEEAERDQKPSLIITELLDMNLRQAYEQKEIRPENRLSIFIDVARALDYLHQRYEPIIHRDVSATNVLLQRLPNNQWKGKVSDLGSANFLQNAQTKGEGAIIYSPPEVIPRAYNPSRKRIPQTVKIDVYSYGVLLCEAITSKLPTGENYGDMIDQVHAEHPPMYELIIHCTKEDPMNRPTMAEVLERLEKMPQVEAFSYV